VRWWRLWQQRQGTERPQRRPLPPHPRPTPAVDCATAVPTAVCRQGRIGPGMWPPVTKAGGAAAAASCTGIPPAAAAGGGCRPQVAAAVGAQAVHTCGRVTCLACQRVDSPECLVAVSQPTGSTDDIIRQHVGGAACTSVWGSESGDRYPWGTRHLGQCLVPSSVAACCCS
jgi:hypothetical protein